MKDQLDELMETEAYLQMEGSDDVSRKRECTGSILDVELAKQVEKSPEYYVCPYTGNKIEN